MPLQTKPHERSVGADGTNRSLWMALHDALFKERKKPTGDLMKWKEIVQSSAVCGEKVKRRFRLLTITKHYKKMNARCQFSLRRKCWAKNCKWIVSIVWKNPCRITTDWYFRVFRKFNAHLTRFRNYLDRWSQSKPSYWIIIISGICANMHNRMRNVLPLCLDACMENSWAIEQQAPLLILFGRCSKALK